MSDAAIEKGTGRSWESWLGVFAAAGADQLSHQEIVEVAGGAGAPPGWRQMVTVPFEQHLGRRVVGQVGDGVFNVSASKTVSGSLDDALGEVAVLALRPR
jgi:hypothetical protein